MSQFVRIAPAKWRMVATASRRRALLHGPAFPAIVAAVASKARVVAFRGQRLRRRGTVKRLVVVLSCPRRLVDLFHNSATGYRAQYYHSTALGEIANGYAVSMLSGKVLERVLAQPKRTCDHDWALQSLLHPEAKIWIRQGLWLRHATGHDRQLLVDRWISNARNGAQRAKRLAHWGTLMPATEHRLELKGGFVSSLGLPHPSGKPGRSEELHKYGFT